MNIKQTLMGLVLAVTATISTEAQQVSLIPLPAEMTIGSGSFVWKDGQKLVYPAYAGDSVLAVCQRFSTDFEKATGVELKLKKRGQGAVVLKIDEQLGPEAYRLTTGPDGIRIEAARPAGFFYAFQTLKQLMATSWLECPTPR